MDLQDTEEPASRTSRPNREQWEAHCTLAGACALALARGGYTLIPLVIGR